MLDSIDFLDAHPFLPCASAQVVAGGATSARAAAEAVGEREANCNCSTAHPIGDATL